MHCPKCGQQQVSEETRFCSRCGFLLSGVMTLIDNEGILPGTQELTSRSANSPRRRGLMQGLFIFLLAFLVVPVITIITIATRSEPFLVVLSAILLTVGGLLRAVYALMFESPEAGVPTLEEKVISGSQKFLNRGTKNALPPQQSVPASVYVAPPGAGNWRDTNDLEPTSVTENTTRFLEEEEVPRHQ